MPDESQRSLTGVFLTSSISGLRLLCMPEYKQQGKCCFQATPLELELKRISVNAMSPIEVHSSVVVITGVTRGLGRAMVDEFVRLGHTVCGCARTRDRIEELTRIYPRHDFQAVDVASDAEVKAWAERLLAEYGPPDFVLNNAAIVNPKASLWEVGDSDFSAEIDINVKGVVNVIRHFVPSMISRRRGVIVNFSSRWGKRFEKQMAPYCATKWAVVALRI